MQASSSSSSAKEARTKQTNSTSTTNKNKTINEQPKTEIVKNKPVGYCESCKKKFDNLKQVFILFTYSSKLSKIFSLLKKCFVSFVYFYFLKASNKFAT
jgi:hypothetical protein